MIGRVRKSSWRLYLHSDLYEEQEMDFTNRETISNNCRPASVRNISNLSCSSMESKAENEGIIEDQVKSERALDALLCRAWSSMRQWWWGLAVECQSRERRKVGKSHGQETLLQFRGHGGLAQSCGHDGSKKTTMPRHM